MDKLNSYRDLIVWQKSLKVVTDVYKLTKSFPQDEMYGLRAHIRKTAVSVPSNIAEGYGRGAKSDYVRFLKIARGSLCELETQLEISCNLGYLRQEDLNVFGEKVNEIERMLNVLIKKVQDSEE